jgi:hypothetical protein
MQDWNGGLHYVCSTSRTPPETFPELSRQPA